MRRMLILLFWFWWFWAGSAHADEPCTEEVSLTSGPDTRSLAAERYRQGQELYSQGDYEGAISRFLGTYCLVPVPEAIFNIAQAYERLVDYEQAVVWFDRYLEVLPATSTEERKTVQNRLAVLRKLPARVRVASEPPAIVRLESDLGVFVSGDTNATEPLRLPAGRYTLRVELAGYEPVQEEVVLEIGQPYTYSYRLNPITGQVRISASPKGARLFLDQKFVGTGSYSDRLPIGTHSLTTEYAGRMTDTRPLEVKKDQVTTVQIVLPEPPRSGRAELLIGSTIFGLDAGWSLAKNVFGVNSGLTLAFLLAGGGVGFAGPYFGAPEDISVGTSSFIIGSAAWGAVEGFALAASLAEDKRLLGPMGLAGSVVFVMASSLSAAHLDLSAGDAALVNSGGLWGSASGLLVAASFSDEELLGPLLLVGLNGGLLAGGLLASRFEVSRGHVALIDLAGLAGAITGMALADASEEVGQDDRTVEYALGGMAIGLGVGALLTRTMDRGSSTQVVPTVTMDSPSGVALFGLSGRF